MPKDMQCLRDLWKTIDPNSSIGCESKLTRDTGRTHDKAFFNRIVEQRTAACAKARDAARRGVQLDRGTAHFIKGLDLRTGRPDGRNKR
jgi:hypothetical protein